MKADIDHLMEEKQVDALYITGSGQNNPAMVYLTGGIEIGHGDLIKKKGETPVLFHSPIERDGAAKAGYPMRSYADFPIKEIMKESGGDPQLTAAVRCREIFESIGLTSGKVAVYGEMDIGQGYSLLNKLKAFFPKLDFDIRSDEDILRRARITKDEREIARIKKMAALTVKIVGNVADFLTTHPVSGDVLVRSDGSPLSISDVKKYIRLLLFENNLQAEDFIFAIGRDAGVPHNMGVPGSVIRLGTTIIFDAYFQEAGGGYFYDFTRTWCLERASDALLKTYEDLQSVYHKVVDSLKINTPYAAFQNQTSRLFEELGYRTLDSHPGTTSGYVHGLGHGIGLQVHEPPFTHADIPENILLPGMAFTIEPGLYDPDEGFGMRIEDSYYFNPKGNLELFAEYPRDLVLKMAG